MAVSSFAGIFSHPENIAMTLRLTISRAILIFGLVTALGLGAVIATSVYGLSQLKVGGPLYNQIKLGNDLIADILPPPEYVIEAYLEATLVLHDPAQLSAHRERIAQLKKEYDERRDFWVKSDLDPALKTKLVDKSDSEVRRFWTAIQEDLLPALSKADSAAATKSYAEITARYTAHRAIIDDIVKQTNDQNAATEVAATERVSTFTLLLWGVSAVVFLIIGAGIFGVAFGVIRPIAELTNVMKGLAGGDLDVSVPALSRDDEVGAMARAVQVFKENALRVQSMESEQTSLKRKAEGDRKAAMQQMADGFDSAIGTIIGQRAVRGGGRGRDGLVGVGNQPPGAGFAQDLPRGGEPGRADKCADCRSRPVRQPDRRSGQNDQRGRRADQPVGAERHDRGGARRRGGTGICRRRIRGQGACRADRESDRGDQRADRPDAVGDQPVGICDSGNRRHHRPHRGNLAGDRGSRGRAGRHDAGNLPQRAAGGARRHPGRGQHHRRQPRGDRYWHGIDACARAGPIATGTEQSSQ